MRRFYLDELGDIVDDSLGLGILKLIIESENKAPEMAKTLIDKAKEELIDTGSQKKVVEFIETIIIYKFPNLSRKEIEAMLNLDLIRETRVYKEAQEEGELNTKLKILPKLVQRGMSIQEIAELLELDVEIIRGYL